jgi:hypothetical protein
MTLRWLAFLAPLLASNGILAQDFCAHRDTNGLAWDQSFEAELRTYFGGRKALLFWENATIADQVMSGLGGPPDPITRLDGNTVIASACRAHSCIEKAAVVITCPTKIVAVGVIHYVPPDFDQPKLTLYSTGTNQAAHSALKQWAAKALGEKSQGMPVRVQSPLQTLPHEGKSK